MFKHEYFICQVFDSDIFQEQCTALEKNIPELKKGDYAVDVDSSQIQIYWLNDKKVRVLNTPIFGVEVNSEVDLLPYFEN
ncbi:MAG: hypothetical protein ACOX05_05770 [Bacillota bacterium]|jgi:hypothetical protein